MDRPNYLQQNMVAELLSEMVIDEQVRLFRKRTLYREIDEALELKNKERFLCLTNELKEIMAYEQAGIG
ncbi:IDEAL domain-containing protein [Brevibacillus massiliensis]|uniref:IDEAL domain-containing protein n=1 Tax=Brevibacillus massiliensis TaxID=1118054 RepID=UPI0003038C0D|nr:IDEAL domain-containing protein [Brevibacillus massiliensis]